MVSDSRARRSAQAHHAHHASKSEQAKRERLEISFKNKSHYRGGQDVVLRELSRDITCCELKSKISKEMGVDIKTIALIREDEECEYEISSDDEAVFTASAWREAKANSPAAVAMAAAGTDNVGLSLPGRTTSAGTTSSSSSSSASKCEAAEAEALRLQLQDVGVTALNKATPQNTPTLLNDRDSRQATPTPNLAEAADELEECRYRSSSKEKVAKYKYTTRTSAGHKSM